jgi:hypothetical protein
LGDCVLSTMRMPSCRISLAASTMALGDLRP